MDEPFSSLDVQTRELMQEELLQLWAQAKSAVLFVTHDLDEAILLADRVAVLTTRPARVKSVHTIDLPRPRDVAKLRYDEDSSRLRETFPTICARKCCARGRGTSHGRNSIPAPATAVRMETLVERLRRRARLVLALRLAVLVFLVGGWELGVRAGLIDPFFFGQPSGIVEKLIDWFQNGTSIGPLWKQIWVTIYEAGAGFLIGAVMGILCGIALGPQSTAVGRVLDLHQGRQFDPARGAGLDLHRRAWPRRGLQDRAGGGDGVLRGVCQRVPGRARGRQEPDRERAHSRRQQLADDARGGDPFGAVVDSREPSRQFRLCAGRRHRRRIFGRARGHGAVDCDRPGLVRFQRRVRRDDRDRGGGADRRMAADHDRGPPVDLASGDHAQRVILFDPALNSESTPHHARRSVIRRNAPANSKV